MKCIKNFFKNYWYNIVAFLFPIIITLLIYLFKGLLTKYDFLVSDSIAQFFPTFKYLKDVLDGSNTFPYTLSKGLGGTMYGAYFYGLSSPTNFLIYFFKDIRLFMLLSTLIKLGLSGLTMYHLLCKQGNKKIYSLFFSFAYSLSTYAVIYSINIMWLDAIWGAPLVIRGIDKILEENKDWLYIVSLVYILISNYYTAYMIVLFSIIYYIYKLYINTKSKFIKTNWKKILHFLLITFFSGLIISFILIPVFIESRYYMRFSYEKIFNLNYLDLFAGTNIGFGYTTNPLNNHSILFYSGTVFIPLLICYFTNKKISKKEKKATAIVYLLFFLPVIFGPLSYVWHLFTYPQSFKCRYAFLMILFTLTLTIKIFKNINGNKKAIKVFYIIYLFIELSLMYSTEKISGYYSYITWKKIVITLVLLYINNILVIKNKKKLILGLLIIELIANASTIYYYSVYDKYSGQNEYEYIKYINSKKEYNNSNNRIEYTARMTNNNSLYFNYKGISSFISSSNKYSLTTYDKLTNNQSKLSNLCLYTQKNILVDLILGVKYILSNYQTDSYKLIETSNLYDSKTYFEENEYALNLGFITSDKVKEIDSIKTANIDEINKLLSIILDKDDNYFIELKVEKKDDKTFIIHKNNNPENSEIYIMNNYYIKNLNNEKIQYTDNYIIIETNKDKEIELKYENKQKMFKAYSLDLQKLKININNIKQFDYKITNDMNNYIVGNIDGNKGVFVTTIPYEPGWKILIDNKEVKYYKVLDAFIAFDIDKGAHEIIFKYEIPGLKISIIISLLGLISLIVYKLRLSNILINKKSN